MKLLLVAALAACFGQLRAVPVADDTALALSSETRAQFFNEFNNLLGGIAKEALESLALAGQNTRSQLQSVQDAIKELETLYNEKVLQELAKYDGALGELGGKVSPCFIAVGQDIKDIVGAASGSAGQCAKETLSRVRQIEQNIEEFISLALDKVHEIVAIGTKCLSENNWIVDQINCALQNAPVAVSIVEEIIKDASELVSQTSREVSDIASDTEQCLAGTVQDAVGEFNTALENVIVCLEAAGGQSDVPAIEGA
ncbi:AGAP009313-PA-like protein [Anopheles sinensis]|uniref:AGAP009313-PA-like protein n=1 Tax=Anopheles sinensis TaxID=74873 RepID=A0A084VM68_ANOSI|nr:AGAP009313-PA-like protein [Anopheles sinensis]